LSGRSGLGGCSFGGTAVRSSREGLRGRPRRFDRRRSLEDRRRDERLVDVPFVTGSTMEVDGRRGSEGCGIPRLVAGSGRGGALDVGRPRVTIRPMLATAVMAPAHRRWTTDRSARSSVEEAATDRR